MLCWVLVVCGVGDGVRGFWDGVVGLVRRGDVWELLCEVVADALPCLIVYVLLGLELAES